MEMEQLDQSSEKLRKQRRKLLAFAIPVAIQALLTIVHLASAYKPKLFPELVFNVFFVATFIYTVVIFLVGVLAAASMTLESISAKIKKDEDHDRQWIRDYFKASKKYNPAYNASFGSIQKKVAGAVISVVYVFALIVDGFVGNAITVFFSVCLIWFGIWMVKECLRMVEESRLKEEARKAKERQASQELSGVSYSKENL